MSVALFTHPDMIGHRPGAGHPERPERLQAVLDALDDAGLSGDRRAATEALVADLERLHPADDLAAFLDASFSPEAIRAKLNEPGAAWWVAERNGELLAFANTGPNTLPHPEARSSHAELRRLYVAKAAQGLGLGTKLLAVALAWMEAHSDGPLWIGVWSGNLKAQKLYAAYGFEKAGEYQFPVGRWLDDEIILRRGA